MFPFTVTVATFVSLLTQDTVLWTNDERFVVTEMAFVVFAARLSATLVSDSAKSVAYELPVTVTGMLLTIVFVQPERVIVRVIVALPADTGVAETDCAFVPTVTVPGADELHAYV